MCIRDRAQLGRGDLYGKTGTTNDAVDAWFAGFQAGAGSPGLVAVIMMVIAAMLTSLTIAREWERGTMEQLASTPVTRLEVVLDAHHLRQRQAAQ